MGAILFLIPTLWSIWAQHNADMAPVFIDDERVLLTGIFIFCYLIIYLGITRMVMALANRFVQGGIFLSALLSIMIVLIGSIVPFVVQRVLLPVLDPRFTHLDYTVLQAPNPVWTFIAIGNHGLTDVRSIGFPLEGLVLISTASLVLLATLLLSAREVDRQREEAPDRVLEEEREQAPARVVEDARSPWDQPDGAPSDERDG